MSVLSNYKNTQFSNHVEKHYPLYVDRVRKGILPSAYFKRNANTGKPILDLKRNRESGGSDDVICFNSNNRNILKNIGGGQRKCLDYDEIMEDYKRKEAKINRLKNLPINSFKQLTEKKRFKDLSPDEKKEWYRRYMEAKRNDKLKMKK